MSPFGAPDHPTWEPSLARRVESACVAFEAQLKQAVRTGQWPALEAHLGEPADPECSALLRELLGLELDYRRRAGEQPDAQAYLARFPEHADVVRDLLQSPPPPPPSYHAAARPAAQAEPVIPGYERLEKLGSGGMGVVYKAWQVRPGRLVALKMISGASLADPEELAARFHTEAEAIGRLNHPNIVQIYEMGDCGGLLYFSMEYVEGGGLDRALAGQPWPPRPAAELVATLAGAVHAVHRQGIIHRDLKPANILLKKSTTDGTDRTDKDRKNNSLSVVSVPSVVDFVPKVTDFGLAKLRIGGKEQTQTDAILGTPSYMAPEQARGGARDVTPAADVYALGAILYAVLTGRAPFLGEDYLEVLAQVVHEEPVPPSRLRTGVPKDLEIICLKCLEKDPRRRYGSAAELAGRLRLFLEGKPIPDRPPGTWERLVRAARRHPAVTTLVGAAAALVLGFVLILVWYNVRLQEDVRRAVARADVQKLLLEGEQARAGGNWEEAAGKLDRAWDQVQAEPTLADLRDQIGQVRAQIRQRQASLTSYRETLRFYQDTLADHFGVRAASGADRATPLIGRMREAVSRLEKLARDPNLSKPQQEELTRDCHELLLVLADAPAAEIRQVVRLLEQAARFGAPPRIYHERLAAYLTRLGERTRASEARREAAKRPADSATAHFLTGLQSYGKRDPDQAARHFEAALRAQRGHFWAYYWLAQCRLLGKRWGDAADAFGECLVQRPDLVALYLGHGFAAGRLKQLATAQGDFDRAMRRNPTKAERYRLHLMFGSACFDSGQLERAAECFRRAADPAPGVPTYDAYASLGQVYRLQGKWEQAAAAFTEVIRQADRLRAPVVADAHAELGRFCLRRALYQEAQVHCDRALQIVPDHPAALRVLADTLLERKNYHGAVSAYGQYLGREGDPTSLRDAYCRRGLALLRLKDYRAAIADYSRALDLDALAPGRAPDPDAYLHRGWAYYFTGAWQLGLKDFEDALRLAERDPPRAAARVVGYLAPSAPGAGPWPAAAVFLTRRSGEAQIGRGNCRVMLGRYREAVADAEAAYERVPRSPEAYHNLACIFAQAIAKVKDDRAEGARAALARDYTARAVLRLRQALALVSPERRREYWRNEMRPDEALAPLHGTPEFERLERELEGRSGAPGR